MWFTFEQALRKKCEQNPDLSLLLSQWEYDRRLVADALQTVVRYFPHYSRHDASHSNTILVQVARVLGQARIDALSATDLWLLLEAAYQHDIGMVVTDEQVRGWWKEPGFKEFLAQLQNSSDPELARAAGLLAPQTSPRELPRDWPIEVSRTLTLVIAEYARRQHAANAERIIRDPERTIGMASPRTHLIPARLFRLLGTICSHHGRSFEDTMRLPLQESGLGTDDAHPRFVACMLRLGDLLDLDNGRFCPVMVRSFGSLPSSSLAHFEKHAAINHLRVSQARIEVDAECESYEAYEVTEQWLDWLRGELKNQMARWSDIMPAPDFGALPSLGEIQARIRGYLTLEPGRRPRFEVDRDQILTLVRGANLYKDRFSFIRELIQNAVDATLLRVWKERWSTKPREELEKLTPAHLRKELKGYPIRVGFQRIESEPTSKRVKWRFHVQDSGTGISLSDVRYIQRIGSSSKNPERQQVIREMPEWMRPSGIFGIGLQSAFLFTDRVGIKTRHHLSQDALELTLQNGQGGNMDGLSIKRLEGGDANLPTGTRVEFIIDLERVPARPWGLRGLIAHEHRHYSFDPVAGAEFPYEQEFTEELFKYFSAACSCPIELEGAQSQDVPSGELFADAYFDPDTNLEITMKAGLKQETLSSLITPKLYYRGAPVHDSQFGNSLRDSLLKVRCNFHASRADELLLLSREDLTERGERLLSKSLNQTIEHFLPRYLGELRAKDANSFELATASLYAWIFTDVSPSVIGDEWRHFHIHRTDDGEEWTLGKLVSQQRVDLWMPNRGIGWPGMLGWVARKAEAYVELSPTDSQDWLIPFLWKSFKYRGYRGAQSPRQTRSGTWVFSNRSEEAGVTRDGLKAALIAVVEEKHRRYSPYYRSTIPCPDDYSVLRYAENTREDFFNREVLWWMGPRMVCPFVADEAGRVTLPSPSKLVEWTARHAEGGPKPEAEVAQALWKFIRECDALMAEEWKNKAYDLGKAKYELGRWLS
jgi:hypothetical protein